MVDTQILARVFSLVAQMESLKATIEGYKADDAPSKMFHEKAEELNGIAIELNQLGGLG